MGSQPTVNNQDYNSLKEMLIFIGLHFSNCLGFYEVAEDKLRGRQKRHSSLKGHY